VNGSSVRDDQVRSGSGRFPGEQTLWQSKQEEKYVCGYSSVVR